MPWDPLLTFWFAEPRRWFAKSQAFDDEIQRTFGARVDEAAAGRLEAWTADPFGTLALLILLDQFPRNIHRGRAAAFAADPLAVRTALAGIDAGFDRKVRPEQRPFYYLPLEHAEDLALQERSVALFAAHLRDAPPSLKSAAESNLDYARRHRDVIARFGRFPHRNPALGRASTADETTFLRGPGSSF